MFFCRVVGKAQGKTKTKNDNLPCANAAIFFPCPESSAWSFMLKGQAHKILNFVGKTESGF
jgi:hypothetical protein